MQGKHQKVDLGISAKARTLAVSGSPSVDGVTIALPVLSLVLSSVGLEGSRSLIRCTAGCRFPNSRCLYLPKPRRAFHPGQSLVMGTPNTHQCY